MFTKKSVFSVCLFRFVLCLMVGSFVPASAQTQLFQEIVTSGAHDFEHFQINGEEFLAVAEGVNDVTPNINSHIYRFESGEFRLFQTIPTNWAADWCFFEIDGQSYLMVANHYNGSHNVNSTIYRWDGSAFVSFQSIPTTGARSLEFFTMGTEHYLAIASYYNGSSYLMQSRIYRWVGSGFQEIQAVNTEGATDVEHFEMNGEHYLAWGNSFNGTTSVTSQIHHYNGTSFVPFQDIATAGAHDWTDLVMDGTQYLINVNRDESVNVMAWTGSQFETVQTISSKGGARVESFTFDSAHYLAVAESADGATVLVDSRVYRWNGSAFDEYMALPTVGPLDVEFFLLNDTEPFLAYASFRHETSRNSTSQIYILALEPPCNGPTIESQPQDAVACLNGSVSLSVTATGDDPLNYQWRLYGENINGATEATYTISNFADTNIGAYDCVVSNACGEVTSEVANLGEAALLILERSPLSATRCVGDTVTFTAVASGQAPAYQWRHNGTNIEGANSPVFTIDSIATTDGGDYDCVITDLCSQLTTRTVSLTVSTATAVNMGMLNLSGEPGSYIGMPILLSSAPVGEITSFSVTLEFDGDLFSYETTIIGNTRTDGWNVYTNPGASSVTIVGANDTPLMHNGVLLVMVYKVSPDAPAGSCAPITIVDALINDGDYCVARTPGEMCVCLKGDVTRNGEITSGDAVQVIRHVAGMPTNFDPITLCEGDTTCNGTISTLDANQIMKFASGEITAFCSVTSGRPSLSEVEVSLPELTMSREDDLAIPVVLSDTTGGNVSGFNFTVTYDPEILELTGYDRVAGLTESGSWQIVANNLVPGQITIAGAGLGSLAGEGPLLYLTGRVLNWGRTQLAVVDSAFNEGTPIARVLDSSTLTILGFDVTPSSAVAGLGPINLEVSAACCGSDMAYSWYAGSQRSMVGTGHQLVIDPAPTETTLYEVVAFDPVSGLETRVHVPILVPEQSRFLDYNGDGCNTRDDLNQAAGDWLGNGADATGDGHLDVRDLLYINLDGCPNP